MIRRLGTQTFLLVLWSVCLLMSRFPYSCCAFETRVVFEQDFEGVTDGTPPADPIRDMTIPSSATRIVSMWGRPVRTTGNTTEGLQISITPEPIYVVYPK